MSPREKENSAKVYVFLPPDIVQSLKVEAKSKGTTVSGLIRMLILEHESKKK